MSKNKKPGGSRGELLDELSSIQSLLGDAAHDVEQDNLVGDEDDIPVLPPVDDDGDAHTQIPLLGADATDDPAQVRKAATARENPFLPKSTVNRAQQSRNDTSKAIEAMIQQRTAATPARATTATPAAPRPAAAPSSPTLSDQQVRALVDEILAAWMPRIERELRDRLIEELKSKS